MLSLKYLRPDPFQEMCNVQCSEKDSGKKLSLQARVIRWIFHKRKRASCFGSCRASVTVEASLVFPIFLCTVACFIGLAQMILVETEVHYAVSQTAKICAKQQMFSLIPEEDDQKSNQVKEDNGIHKSDRTNGRQSIRNASSVFFDIYDAKSLCDSLVEGGRKGISVQSAFSSEEEVQVKAIYTLKLSVPFFRPIRFQKDTAVKRRVFSGYVKHRRDYDAAGDNSIVYVAENGVVYHKNASCSHICLKITGNAAIQDIVHSSKYAACEKCIHKGSSLSAIFVTAYGDCYHSTLGCSGLKRTIKAVRLKDVDCAHVPAVLLGGRLYMGNKGMMTVEASVVVPIILIIVVTEFFFGLFLIDMSVVKSETMRLADEAADVWKTDGKLANGTYKSQQLLLRNKNFLQKNRRGQLISKTRLRLQKRIATRLNIASLDSYKVSISGDKVLVQASVRLGNPLLGGRKNTGIKGWIFKCEEKADITNEEELLRKLSGNLR